MSDVQIHNTSQFRPLLVILSLLMLCFNHHLSSENPQPSKPDVLTVDQNSRIVFLPQALLPNQALISTFARTRSTLVSVSVSALLWSKIRGAVVDCSLRPQPLSPTGIHLYEHQAESRHEIGHPNTCPRQDQVLLEPRRIHPAKARTPTDPMLLISNNN
jgi:hypothetical protein